MLQGFGETGMRARQLRRDMSLPEVLLWTALRGRSSVVKFRRQHPSGPYVADFYCHAARMVVEIDGAAHDCGDRPVRDAARDGWFAARGLTVVRIAASRVLQNADATADAIVALAERPLHRPLDGLPPRTGEV